MNAEGRHQGAPQTVAAAKQLHDEDTRTTLDNTGIGDRTHGALTPRQQLKCVRGGIWIPEVILVAATARLKAGGAWSGITGPGILSAWDVAVAQANAEGDA